MREKLMWFSAGALLTAVVAFAVAHFPSGPDLPTTTSSDDAGIAQRLDAIERTLGQLVQRERVAGDSRIASDQRRTDAPLEPAGKPVSTDAAEFVTAASRTAAEKGSVIIDGAVASGYWSRRNAQELLAVSGQMSAEDRLELYRKLSVAINEDRIEVEAGTLPR